MPIIMIHSERPGSVLFSFSNIKLSRMKKNQELLKSIKGKNTDTPSKPLPPGTLYVVCLNKPLIDLWATSDHNTNDYYDSSTPYSSSVYLNSDDALLRTDNIPVILSPEEEMLLYNEGLTEYY
jgi:hypothetical protein